MLWELCPVLLGTVYFVLSAQHQGLGIRTKQQLGIRRINLGDGERKTHFKLSSSFLKIFVALKFALDGVLTTSTSLLLSSLPVATCQ